MTEENSREKTAMRAGDFSQAMAEDDARRLAACWNACIGFSTPELENILMLGATMRSRFEARNAAEREAEQELEALRHVYECVRGYLRFDGVDPARATAYAQQLQNAVEVVKEIDGGNFDPASKDRLSSTESGEYAAPQAVQAAVPAVRGEVLVTVSGFTGSGKSAIAGEIEIMCRALGLQVEWPDGVTEKNMTHADWTTALELYNPRVRIIERNVPRNTASGADQ